MTTDADKDELIRALEAKAAAAEAAVRELEKNEDHLRKTAGGWFDRAHERRLEADELRADRDRLAGEVERLESANVALCVAHRDAADEVARLTSELEKARENEARYLALIATGSYVPSRMNKRCPWGLGAGYGRPATKAELDAAIDAARRAGEGEAK